MRLVNVVQLEDLITWMNFDSWESPALVSFKLQPALNESYYDAIIRFLKAATELNIKGSTYMFYNSIGGRALFSVDELLKD